VRDQAVIKKVWAVLEVTAFLTGLMYRHLFSER